jgi:hypothetical protein
MSAAQVEAPRPLRKPGDTDAATFSWADRDAGLYGLARVATGIMADGEPQPSALTLVLAGREPLSADAVAGAQAGEALTAVTDAPLERWTVSAPNFELTFEALTQPASYGGRERIVKAGGMEGYEQHCRVRGSVAGRRVNGLGQRSRSWGNPDWDKIVLTRSVGAWFDDGSGYTLAAVRTVKHATHADEAMWSIAFPPGEQPVRVDEPRLSTTTDEAGRHIRAGLELWLSSRDDYPHRGLGEVISGTTLELGALRLDVAFFDWHIEGRRGIGRYDVIRRS